MKWIFLYEPPAGCEPSPQDLTHIESALDSLAAHPCPSPSSSAPPPGLHLTCTFMRPPPPPEDFSNRAPSSSLHGAMRPTWLVQCPSFTCLVDKEKERATQVDENMVELIEKKLDYKETNVVKMGGRAYELGGLLLSPAAVTYTSAMGGQTSFLGHIIEVEIALDHASSIRVEGDWPRDNVSKSIGETLNESLSSLESLRGQKRDHSREGDQQHQNPRLRLVECSCLEDMAKKRPGTRFGSMQLALYYCEVASLLLKIRKA